MVGVALRYNNGPGHTCTFHGTHNLVRQTLLQRGKHARYPQTPFNPPRGRGGLVNIVQQFSVEFGRFRSRFDTAVHSVWLISYSIYIDTERKGGSGMQDYV